MVVYYFMLLKVIQNPKLLSLMKDKIILAIMSKLQWLEIREPMSEGEGHDRWEEKIELLEDAADACEDAITESDPEQARELLEQCKNYILEYQQLFGGLSRIHI